MKPLVLMALIVAALGSNPGHAQQKAQPGADQVRRLQDAQQRLTAEKNRIAAEKTKLEEDIKKAQSEADEAKANAQKQVASQQGTLRRLNSRVAELEKQLAESQNENNTSKDKIIALTQRTERAEQLNDQLRSQIVGLQETVRIRDTSLAQATARGTTLSAELTDVRRKNSELGKLTRELLDAYDQKGFSQVFGQREPLLGLGRVGIENRLQTFGDRIEENTAR